MSLTTPATLGPTKAGERIEALDVARGIALLGIFMVNIQMMAQPMQWMFLGGGKDDGPIGLAAHYVTRIFFESKSYPLFSMLFGMGLVLMHQRASAAGRAFAPAYLRRIALLLCFGIGHAFFVWYGDILIYYACLAVVVMWFAPLKARTMVTIAIALAVAASLWAGGLGVAFTALAGMGEPPPSADAETFEEFWTAMTSGEIQGGPELDAWANAELDAFGNGPFANAVGMRAINWFTGTIFWMVLFGVVMHVPAMFLLGGAIMKAGVLTDPVSPWPRRFMLMGALIGVPGAIVATSLIEVFGYESVWSSLATAVTHLTGPLVSLGYVGLAVWLARSGVLSWLVGAIASAGRMALTNYLSQSLVVAFLAQHWGLGWFGEVDRGQMLWIVLGVYACQMVFSSLWLSVFTMGPLEYVWRCGTYLKLPRLKKPNATVDQASAS